MSSWILEKLREHARAAQRRVASGDRSADGCVHAWHIVLAMSSMGIQLAHMSSLRVMS